MEHIRSEATAALNSNRDMMKERTPRTSHRYQTGEQIWIEAKHIKSNRPSQKLDHQRYGPFEVIEPVGEGAYRIKIPDTWLIHDVFNERLITPYHETSFKLQKKDPPPPPDIMNDEEHYEVEKIRGVRKKGRGMQYLVHWKGYPNEEDTWEPLRMLKGAEEAIQDYHKRFPEKNLKRRR
jgi:hypothetical protein